MGQPVGLPLAMTIALQTPPSGAGAGGRVVLLVCPVDSPTQIRQGDLGLMGESGCITPLLEERFSY